MSIKTDPEVLTAVAILTLGIGLAWIPHVALRILALTVAWAILGYIGG